MSPMLEDELRATLAAHAHDLTPPPHLADAAMSRAVRLRRTKRLQVAAGALAVVGVVALVPVLAALGPDNHSAPPVQPTPSAVPVPASVLAQARETHALLGMPTTIVDGTGSEVVTLSVAPPLVDSNLTPQLQLRGLHRANGGYVTWLLPSLFGAWTYDTAPPGVINFVRPDGSATLLGHPTPDSGFTVSPDGSLVAFVVAASSGEKDLVVTDLDGRTLHERAATGPLTGLYLTREGLWLACVFPTCKDTADRVPHYWDFSSNAITTPPLADQSVWLAQSGDVLIAAKGSATPSITAYDVSDPSSPVSLWTSPIPAAWGGFDGSGALFLVGDEAKERAVLLDAATGKELDQLKMGSMLTNPIWTPNDTWLMYALNDDATRMDVGVITPASDGTLSATSQTYDPYETRLAELPTFPTIGFELPPPQP